MSEQLDTDHQASRMVNDGDCHTKLLARPQHRSVERGRLHCDTRLSSTLHRATSSGTKDDSGSAVQEVLEMRIAVGQDLCTGHDSRGVASLLIRAWINGIEQVGDARPEKGAWWIAMLGWDLVVCQGGRM